MADETTPVPENDSIFLPLQTDVCAKDPEEPPEKDKICPTCIPNPNAIVPTWYEQPLPFLNEKTCEYSVAVAINDFGDAFTTHDVGNSEFYEPGNDDPMRILRRTFIRQGIRKMLRHYGKKESDDIVCATLDVSQVPDASIWSPVAGATAAFVLTTAAILPFAGGLGATFQGAASAVMGEHGVVCANHQDAVGVIFLCREEFR